MSQESRLVLNIVWTGGVFSLLRPLTTSVLDHSDARVRFVANACPREEILEMERYGEAHPGRVTDVVVVSEDRMVRHGAALDHVLSTCDDGDLFGLLDPDIFVRGPFLPELVGPLGSAAAVTAGKEVWSDGNTRPTEHPGVSGEFFFDDDGFVFGSPHLAVYRADVVRETTDRWGIGFGSVGNDVSDEVKQRLAEMGRAYWVYDTAKLVNILMQGDGHELVHTEPPNVVHIGGVAHYLAPPSTAPAARDKPAEWGEGSEWTRDPKHANRAEVARYTAELLMALRAGEPVPPLPDAGRLTDRLEMVRDGLIGLRRS